MIEKKERPGSLLIDALLAIVIFGAVVAAFSNGILQGQQGTLRGNNRTRAVYLAEEGLQAIRSIRDQSDGYVRITSRTLDEDDGVQVVTGTGWTIVDDATVIDGMFTRRIIFSTGANSNERKITSIVTWSETQGDSLSVTQTSFITNWTKDPPKPPPDWSQPILKGSYATLDDSYEAVALYGTGAFVVGNSLTASGFYVFDIEDLASPTLVDWADINAKLTDDGHDSRAWDIVISGNYAYIGTNSTDGKKIKIIDITQSDITCCVAEIDLGGGTAGEVRGVAVSGSTLYAVRYPGDATVDYYEFVKYDVSTPATPVADGVLNEDTLDMYRVSVQGANGTGVFIAADHPEEIVIVDVDKGHTPNPEKEAGENVGGNTQGYSIAYLSGSLFLGTKGQSSGNTEVFAFDSTKRPLNTASEYDMGGFALFEDVNDITVSILGQAGLLAAYKKLQNSSHPCGGALKYNKYFFVTLDFGNVNNITSLYDDYALLDPLIGCKERGYGIDLRQSDETAALVTGKPYTESTPGGTLILLQPTYSW
jgi:hypothetical protein